MSEKTRTIPLKPHVVIDPSGKRHYAYASTKAGAIKAVRDTLPKPTDEWDAWLAPPSELIAVGRAGAIIINDPEPQNPVDDNQLDAFPE